jgi:hypothetical protein
MRLVVEIQAVGDQLFEFDLGSHLERPTATGTVAALITPITPRAPIITGTTITGWAIGPALALFAPLIGAAAIIGARRAIFALLPLRARTLRTRRLWGRRRRGRLDGDRHFSRRRYFRLHFIRHNCSPLGVIA